MSSRRFLRAILISLCIACAGAVTPTRAEVKLPPVLSSHMVLQQGMRVPIWGTAAAGEKVTVTFRGQSKTAVADDKGKWRVDLDPLEAGGPDRLVVAGTNTVTLDDVLVGEVWVGSGQSNMAGGVNAYAKADGVLRRMSTNTYPTLRLARRGGGGWQTADPAAINGFSALLFAFGARLNQEMKVPIGLMVGAVGGTPSGYWLSDAAYRAEESCQAAVAKDMASGRFEREQKQYTNAIAAWTNAVEKAKKTGMAPPNKPFPPLKPGECRGKIGNLYEAHIRHFIPFAIRGVLWDQGEGGTAIGGVDQYTLMGALIQGWRREWGMPTPLQAGGPGGAFPFLYVQKPSGGGCAWDPTDHVTREASPFAALPPVPPSDGAYRELHIRIMQYTNTAMVISSDLGSNTHPVNKSGYGTRAARVARGMVYGHRVEFLGPLYLSHTVEGNKIRVRFSHVGQGLAFRPADKPQGFAVAGADKVFHWANAAIEGEVVVVSSDKVPNPVAVRYAWAAVHPWANLFNRDGLPAIEFRTDTW
jgi:sialate O-acetylesterase